MQSLKTIKDGQFLIIISIDNGYHHLSISHKHRYPRWDEIKKARDKYLPKDKDFAMFLPGEGDYVNLHPNCFHLWEMQKEHCGIDRLN